jgi:putative MATE family efflux protein
MEERVKQLGEEKVSKLLFKFALPAIIGMLVNAMYNIIDRIFIGHIGTPESGEGILAISGITIAFPVMMILMGIAMLIGFGAAPQISIKLGEKKIDEAEKVMGNAAIMLVLVTIVTSFFGILFLEPMLKLFGASPASLPYAKDYVFIILLGAPAMAIGFGMNSFIRAEGNLVLAMTTMLIGVIINAILAPIFIFTLGLGIKGAAIATVIAQIITATWVLAHFLSGRSMLKLNSRSIKLDGEIIRKTIILGVGPFSMQMATSALNAVMNRTLFSYGGDLAISSMGIVMSISTLFLMPLFGINQASQPIIGFNLGAKKYERVKKTLKIAMIGATGIVLFGFIIIMIFPQYLISIFNNTDQELMKMATKILRTYLIFLPIIGIQIIGAGYFQAAGKPKHSTFLSLSRQVIFLLPTLIIFPMIFGFNGILYAGPFADICSTIITILLVLREVKKLNIKQEQVNAAN